ncbi:MAG TPA: CBS domain-containing protein [Kofleriaceae bacterium]|nr:CBS domain-containing protein [Kofleriaceae bacterium]
MKDSCADRSQPIQHIYRSQGVLTDRALRCEGAGTSPERVATIADQVPVTQIMTRQITCARRDLTTAQLVDLVVHNRIGCVPVVEDPGRPIGMITKLDLVEQMLAADRGEADAPSARSLLPGTAGELMMPLAITLGEHASVAHAAALMAAEEIHHVPIVDANGRMIGIVSAIDIVRWLAENDGFGSANGSAQAAGG